MKLRLNTCFTDLLNIPEEIDQWGCGQRKRNYSSFCPDEEHGVYIAFIEGPVVKRLLMRLSPEETIEKAKKVINERLDGEEIILMGMSFYI